MKIQAKSSRRTIPPHPDVVRLVQDLQNIPKNELADFIQRITHWSWPRSELHVWFGVLDRFDEIMESLIAQYDAANLQLTPFSDEDKALLFQILRFERMLLDNSTNRKLFSSYDRLSILVMSPDVDIATEALSLILRPAHQYTLQMSLNVVLRVNHSHLEFLARTWHVLREYSTSYLKLLSPQEENALPPEASDVRFQWYSPKSAATDHGPHSVHLKSLASDSRDVMAILQDAIDGHAISQNDRFDLMCRIRVAKSLAKDQLPLRSKLVTLRLLAIAVYCHTHTEMSGQNARLLSEPDIVSSTAPLLAIDRGIEELVQAAAVHALDGICHHRARSNEVLTAVNASVAHGLLMSLFRKTVAKLDEPSTEPYAPLFEALQSFLDFLTTNEVSYNMIISAGLIEHLRKIVSNRQPSRSIVVARTIPLLESTLYGPPQAFTAGQRGNNPFSQFISDNGIPFLLDRIKFEVDADIAEYKEELTESGPPLGYGKVPAPRINVLKHLLRTIQRMLSSAGSAEVLRLLPEPDSAFIPSLKSILDHRALFGSTILAAATLVIATWVHNEPSSLTIIQESKLPDSFYRVVEQGIEPMIEVIHGILNAIGALSLNQAGQNLLQSRTKVIPTIFSIFTSELHVSPLQEKSNASLIGGDVDELVRHHPWLKPGIFKGITDVLSRIEALANEYKPKEGCDGYFNLVPVNKSTPGRETPMDTDLPRADAGTATIEKANTSTSTQPTFELNEMPVYQFLNNFSKFLVGFLSHAAHCREILAETDILVRLDRILTLPCWPIEFPMARNLEAVLMVNRRLMDASPGRVLKHRIDTVKVHMALNEDFRQSRGSDNKIVQYVALTEAESEVAQGRFMSMRKLLLHLILLNDVYSQSSHSIHQPFRREVINMLEPLIEDSSFIPQIGTLFKASAWEILHLSVQHPETSKKESDPSSGVNGATPGPSTQAASQVPNQGPSTPAPNTEHPFAAFIPRKRLLAPEESKGKAVTSEERNHMNIKSVLHAFSNVLQSMFSGISKALPVSRRMNSADVPKFKKDSKVATKILADTLVDGLRSYDASDDPIVVMGFCALAISSTSCIGPESRHGQNMQTGLFLEFEKSGGIDAVVNVCTFCADLIDRFSGIQEDARSTKEREIMGIAHYFLRHPLIWFYHLVSGKPLIDSPQTSEIVRYKTFEDFDPATTIVRLRLTLLPIFRRFWESKWLTDTSESVRKAIIFGLLAILKEDHENQAAVTSSGLSIPGHIPLIRRQPPPPSPTMIQQLTDMGFSELAVRSALIRTRNDPVSAADLLLNNPPLSDGEDAANGTHEDHAEGSSDSVSPSFSGAAEPPGEPQSVSVEQEKPDAAPTSKRDYPKELAQAREELKETIVPNALRLADANPAFIDDIRDVFIGPSMKGNAKTLFNDIKKFSDGAGDVPEIPLQVRCRILALAYLKVGTKDLGLTKDDSNELLQSLLALLLAGPVPGTPSEPNLPKWLSSHMLLSDRILCSSEDINHVDIMKEGESISPADLHVGPAFIESRRVLFDFCMRLARIPNLPKDDLLSLFGVLAFLTKDYALATEFVRSDGLQLVLQYFKDKRQQDDVAAVSMGIFRHTMEDPHTVETYIRQDLKRWGSATRGRPGETVNNFVRAMPHAALRDPKMFLKITTELCSLTDTQTSISGSYRIRLKDDSDPSTIEDDKGSPKSDKAVTMPRPFDDTPMTIATAVIHHLIGELMTQSKPNADQPAAIAGPSSGATPFTTSTATSGENTPTLASNPRTQLQVLSDLSNPNAKEIDYARFIHNLLSELLLSYEICKVAFLTYPRNKALGSMIKDIAKVKPLALSFLLQEITKGDSTDWSKKSTKATPYQALVLALCADVNGMPDTNTAESHIPNVRKSVLDTILRGLKDPITQAAESTEQRYGRYIALGDLCQRLLTFTPQMSGPKSQEDAIFHIAKTMLEKNYIQTFSSILSELDLSHPMSASVTSSIIAPLEALTKASIRIGRIMDQPTSMPNNGEDRIISTIYSTESEGESVVSDAEEAPDPYSTSALGMYGGETEGAFVDVEEPLNEEEEEDVEMDYAEDDYGSEESHEDDEEPMDASSAGVELHDDDDDDDDDTDEDHEMVEGEGDEEGAEDDASSDEDGESVSEQDQEASPGELGEHIWEELDVPRDESGILLGPEDDDDDDDEGLDVLDPSMSGALDDLAYALGTGDVGGPPVFVQPPRPIGEELDPLGDGHRLLDLGNLIDQSGSAGNFLPPMEIYPPFDHAPEDFGRAGHRRSFRPPQIIRTSMLSEMLGAPTAQMIQDMARGQNGDIHLALSGPAAQLFFRETGLSDGSLRPRIVSRYMTARPGRSSSGRDSGLSASMTTSRRWSEEARVNAGPSYDERLAEITNHLVNSLLPAAREAAEIAKAEEATRRKKEEEERAKAEREAREKEEAEAKAREEAEAALERQRMEAVATAPIASTDQVSENVVDVPQDLQSQEMEISPSTSAPEPTAAEASTTNDRSRVTVMYRGESIDITDADIDPEFLNAVPEDIRDEILGNFVREQQRQSRPARTQEAEMDMDFLNALPADIREDVLRGQAIAQITGAVDMDPASVLATLPESLRQTVLLEQEDAVLEAMPSALLAEANALRAQRMTRRAIPMPIPTNTTTSSHLSARKQNREIAQLLDKSGLANLVRLLFFIDQTRRTSLQQVLVNLSENTKSRNELLHLLLALLNGNKADLSGIDKSFAQLSVRGNKSSAKGKQREDSSAIGTIGDRVPEEHVVLQYTLDTLTALVHANESASLFFLTEQEAPPGIQRAISKKGKGKERQLSGPHYPFVQLLALLERQNLVHQSHSQDAISSLLFTVTKPLTVLREQPKKSDDAQEKPSPSDKEETSSLIRPTDAANSHEPVASTQEAQSSSSNVPNTQEEGKPAEVTESPEKEGLPKEDPIRSKPPQFPESSLKLVANLLTMGECSSKCFQNTQGLIFNLSSLPQVRDVIISELTTRAEDFGKVIYNELEALLRSVHSLKKGDELPSSVTAKFSLPTSNQTRLLRILKILENIYMPSLPGRSTPGSEATSTDDEIRPIFEKLHFASLWKKLSDCLRAVEDRLDATHVATFLLPLMESLMVVCKSTSSPSAIAATKALRASASPRSPTLEREVSGDVFVTFTDKHRKVLNLMVRNKPSLMNGSFSLLVQNPRVLDFDNKRNYFIHKLRHRSRLERERESYPTVAISVRRAKVFEESFQSIMRLKANDLKYGKLNVRFNGEEGVDAGGVTREWFRILAREIFNPNYALFAPCGADRLTYQPNPASGINPDHLRYFKFVGRILGKAIYDQRLLDGHFARSVYRQLLGKAVDYRDLEWSDPSYYNGLRWMLDNSVEAMDLTFSEQSEQLGEMVVVDLKPNGRNIPVTDENKDEYIQLIAEYRLTTSIKQQLDSFLEGFYEVVPKEHIVVFDEKELELLISGTPDIDVEDWRSATEYHGYTASDTSIVWWWRALKSFSRADRAKVLSFATGTAKVPLGGFSELQGVDGIQRFSIHKDYGPMDRLPQAHTCFNQIDLPQYSSYEKLRQQLLLAINEGGEGFGFA